ncbi:MAG: 23S rRNA (cytosine(1962)-C(5))-methyltransferase RlmI, partial [Kiritimatiellae bacterium]|nr:23S rRNA (cytosine(1962)-C(5))-methyltransferase RlmI [Kiritimatiellia bacterium]
MPKLTLKPGREHSLARRHPWIFSGAVAAVDGDAAPGDAVDIFSSKGGKLGIGAYSPDSQIRARILSFGDCAIPDMANLVRERVFASVARRGGFFVDGYTNG